MRLTKDLIKAEALRLGFSFIGFSKPNQTPHFSQYEEWIRNERYADLGFLAKEYVLDARFNPSILLENSQTVITVGIAYEPQNLPNTFSQANNEQGVIASYACIPDYHNCLREKAQELIGFINKIENSKIKSRFFVDSGPVMEKDFAYKSGLGWIGKNSLFISPLFGSYCLLGCLFLDIEFPPDRKLNKDVCENCEACIHACPTNAINKNKTIDAARCISYLTTLCFGEIDRDISKKIGNRVFGCDVCQTICPQNIKNQNKDLINQICIKPLINKKIDLISELFLDEREFLVKYSNTPVARFPHELFLRNIIISIGNSGLKKFLIPLSKIMENRSSSINQNASLNAIDAIQSVIPIMGK